jgi:NAD(P)-dependent dehydrogenase (short-subunit alcohol dehydrogenase family)
MSKHTSTILITGGTQGLGYHCALTLAAQSPTSLIILASRTDPNNAASLINTKLKQSNVQYMPLDLGSLSKVRLFAQKYTEAHFPPISALVLNAGVQLTGPTTYTPDGFESQFGINHVGHALLFHLLAPSLTPTARIVVVSSGLHDPRQGEPVGIVARYTSAERVAHPTDDDKKESNGRDRYATSKAANIIWAFALGRHSHATQRTVLAFDPGLMFGTNFARDASWFLRLLNKTVLPYSTKLVNMLMKENVNTPQTSGGNMAWLVLGKELEGRKGIYFDGRREREAGVLARDEGVQEELWEWTIKTVKGSEEEERRFRRFE